MESKISDNGPNTSNYTVCNSSIQVITPFLSSLRAVTILFIIDIKLKDLKD